MSTTTTNYGKKIIVTDSFETYDFEGQLTFDKFSERNLHEPWDTQTFSLPARCEPSFYFKLIQQISDNRDHRTTLSVAFKSRKEPSYYNCEVSVVNRDGKFCHTEEYTKLHKDVAQIFSIDYDVLVKEGYIWNDKLTFQIKVTFKSGISTVEEVPVSDEKAVLDDFAALFDSAIHSDVTFLVSGKEIPAHKAILSARSPYFASLFKRDTYAKVDIPDVEPAIFEQLLRFIYSGRVSPLVDYGQTMKLLAAADRYQLASLKANCEDALRSHISSDSVHELIVLADQHNAIRLKVDAMDFFKRNTQAAIEAMFANNKTDALLDTFKNLAITKNDSASGAKNN